MKSTFSRLRSGSMPIESFPNSRAASWPPQNDSLVSKPTGFRVLLAKGDCCVRTPPFFTRLLSRLSDQQDPWANRFPSRQPAMRCCFVVKRHSLGEIKCLEYPNREETRTRTQEIGGRKDWLGRDNIASCPAPRATNDPLSEHCSRRDCALPNSHIGRAVG